MFHTGFTVLGADSDGGKGIALDYGRPLYLDSLARDFSGMRIIAAHPGWPWQEELIAIATLKKTLRGYIRLPGGAASGHISKGY